MTNKILIWVLCFALENHLLVNKSATKVYSYCSFVWTRRSASVVVVVAHIYPPVTGQRQRLTYWTIPILFIALTTSWLEESATALEFPTMQLMFLWISSNSCPLNLLLVRSHQTEIIIVKRLIQGRNNVNRVRVEPRSFDQGRRKNDAFTFSATLLTLCCLTTPTQRTFLASVCKSFVKTTTMDELLKSFPRTHCQFENRTGDQQPFDP